MFSGTRKRFGNSVSAGKFPTDTHVIMCNKMVNWIVYGDRKLEKNLTISSEPNSILKIVFWYFNLYIFKRLAYKNETKLRSVWSKIYSRWHGISYTSAPTTRTEERAFRKPRIRHSLEGARRLGFDLAKWNTNVKVCTNGNVEGDEARCRCCADGSEETSDDVANSERFRKAFSPSRAAIRRGEKRKIFGRAYTHHTCRVITLWIMDE